MAAWFELSALSLPKTAIVVVGVATLALLDIISRVRHRPAHYVLGVVLGTVLSLGLMHAAAVLLNPAANLNAYVMALGVLLVFVAWRLLFGTWAAPTKATVLGTFLFWIVFHILSGEEGAQRTAHLIAIGVALVPAVVWMAIFLPYHREKSSVALSMFFGGMLSTVPILFYDALVRRGTDLHFFLFSIHLESFSRSAHAFVGDAWPNLPPVSMSVVAMLVSFVIVGLIEEGSKFWVLQRLGRQYATSIDDMLQLAILVAIGFAFAENITSTGYFVSFVQDYLMGPSGPQWGTFLGNIAGRSILTTMVHIVSTGVIGYFLGLATFAGPYLEEAEARGRRYRILEYIHQLFGMPKKDVFRRELLLCGYLIAAALHATSNILVTLPDILPGHPRTLGDIVGAAPGSPLHLVVLLLVPTVVYVIGGFFLLSWLFNRTENRKERGHLIEADTFVSEEAAA